MTYIEFKNVSFTYNSDRKDREKVIEDLNLKIQDGEFLCLIGPSGTGKTTILNMLAGLLKPGSGSIIMGGEVLNKPSTDRAVVFQNYSLFPWMTAIKNVIFGIEQAGKISDKSSIISTANLYLDRVGMGEAKDKYPSQLSGGMKQRVSIARALAMDPSVLLLDEPFGALDAKRRWELQELLEDLFFSASDKKTVVFVTHDIDEAIVLADRIVCIDSGGIKATFEVAFPRPRKHNEIRESQDYDRLKKELFQILGVLDGWSEKALKEEL